MELLGNPKVIGQTTMPDNVCAGQTRHYYVNPNPVPGSTYTWWIDDIIQAGLNSNYIDHTWDFPGTYLIEVQELAANGCLGPRRASLVFVTALTIPTFTAVGSRCSGSIIPPLPSTSIEGITGVWSPAISNTLTATYTFTPDAGQCAAVTTMDITITNPVTPLFDQIGPLNINSSAPALPSVSNNGIRGTWDPLAINTSAAGTFTFRFIPDADQCATTAEMNIEVIPAGFATMTVTKTVDHAAISSPSTLNYFISVTNTGTVGLTQLTVTDALTNGATYASGDDGNGILDPDETWIYTASYDASQGDIDSGNDIINNVSVTSNEITRPVTDRAVTTINSTSLLTVTKRQTGGPATVTAAGQVITYQIVLTNTGTTNITGIVPTETYPGNGVGTLSDPVESISNDNILNPGETWTYTATYTVTQADIDAGNNLVNTIRITSVQVPGPLTAQAVTPVAGTSDLDVIKTQTSTAPITNAGQVITYQILVINRGTTNITGIRATEIYPGSGTGALSAPHESISANGVLNVGETWSYTATYRVTQADIDAGRDLVNTIRVTTDQVPGPFFDRVTTPVIGRASLNVTKSTSATNYTIIGQRINYQITVTNNGNVTVTGVVVNDPNTDVTCTGVPRTLLPNASMTCTAVHIVTAADITSGSIRNIATATGLDPDLETITANSNEVVVRLNNSPPAIICPVPIVTNTGAETCNAEINGGLSAVISDPNNNIESLTWVMTGATEDQSPSTGINNLTDYTFNAGVTTVSYTVTDEPGLYATCSFTVTVTDNIPPRVECVGPQNKSTDIDGPNYTVQGTEFDPVSVWDNCTIESIVNDFNGSSTLAGAEFPIGTTTVTWTVTDIFGNSAACSFNVSVVDDVPPVARCRDIDVYLDLITGIITILPSDVDNGSFDNTAIASMTIDRDFFTCSDLGPNSVTLTVTDIYNNIGSCTATATVHYAVPPHPLVTPAEDVICNKTMTNLVLTNNIPSTTWRWTADASPEISGASNDNSGSSSTINQNLNNRDLSVHNVIYNIIPRVYGHCDLPMISATVWVNPDPEIRVSAPDTVLCDGESAVISVQDPNTTVRGQWMYDLTVEPEPGITGNTPNGTYTSPTDLTETLYNDDTRKHKIVYRFTPRIQPDDGGPACEGKEITVTLWVHPRIRYTTQVSNYSGYNISCFGKANGFIKVDPMPELAPYNFRWTGPAGFTSSKKDIYSLIAGQYNMVITDKNGCSVSETFDLSEPARLGMNIQTSVSLDGNYNIDCYGGKTGSITVTAVNNIGQADYLWLDGTIGNSRNDLQAGNYKVVITDSNNCQADSSITLTQPEQIKLIFDLTEPFCPEKPDGEIRLNVTGGIPGNYTYLWSDNSTDQNISNIPAGLYKVAVTDMNSCTVKDSVWLHGLNKICLIIPEAISPNKDQINDVWNIGNSELYPKMEITIYNRWGQMVWKSEKGYPVPWDGRSRGRNLPIDSYHYVIDLHNDLKPIVGTITIIR